jgi:hypothetical protein
MLQKTQWTMAATALAVGACFIATARPAQAQVRHHMSRGGVTTIVGTGIVMPKPTSQTTPAGTGIVTPPPTSSPPPPSPTPAASPKPTPAPAVTPPVVTPPPVVTTPPVVVPPVTGWFGGGSIGSPSGHASPQGFSAGPTLMGEARLPLGHMVDRIGPAIIGDNGPTVQKVMAHH